MVSDKTTHFSAPGSCWPFVVCKEGVGGRVGGLVPTAPSLPDLPCHSRRVRCVPGPASSWGCRGVPPQAHPQPLGLTLGRTEGEQTHRARRGKERSEDHASQGVWGARGDRRPAGLPGRDQLSRWLLGAKQSGWGPALPRPFAPRPRPASPPWRPEAEHTVLQQQLHFCHGTSLCSLVAHSHPPALVCLYLLSSEPPGRLEPGVRLLEENSRGAQADGELSSGGDATGTSGCERVIGACRVACPVHTAAEVRPETHRSDAASGRRAASSR